MHSDLREVTEDAWHALCESYDVTCEGMAVEGLFSEVDIADPDRAAEVVLVNAILEMIERIDRFSPWYTEAGAAFGLEPEKSGSHTRWKLTPEAADRYRPLLDRLAEAIKVEGATLGTLRPTGTDRYPSLN